MNSTWFIQSSEDAIRSILNKAKKIPGHVLSYKNDQTLAVSDDPISVVIRLKGISQEMLNSKRKEIEDVDGVDDVECQCSPQES